jgi:cysteine synthase A
MAVDRMKQYIPSGATCVVIFPDRGERYLDTIYSDEWVAEHFGDDAFASWQNYPEDRSWMTAAC